MKIFIDADAFPNVIRDILIKASQRLNLSLIFVANKPLRLEKLSNLSLILVPEGPDVADDRIAESVRPGDLVITADIPLADRVVAKEAFAMNPIYLAENQEAIGGIDVVQAEALTLRLLSTGNIETIQKELFP